ncbi:MAG TPA: nitrite reductase [Cytophagales bacterium]|nr:nitrite reductase [Cytophagales bacterium]
MLGFISELENPIVQKDIIDLEKRIRLYREGKITDEKMRSLRLVRGIYGQRQPGVQMIRIKIPQGVLTFKQLLKICDISDKYASKNLHLTTRQDIQIHYVSLDRTPELYSELAKDDLTLREACGNTVRNVTASPTAGIDPNEPFDVTPYANTTTHYFLRNPISHDMARKFKISFSASDEDTAFSFIHDVGLIPKIKEVDGKEVRGFKVVIGGGLGAQPLHAFPAYDFLPADQIIPLIEGVIRVFDRYGERANRNKARLKYLIAKVGFEELMRMVEEERLALKSKTFPMPEEPKAVVIPEPRPNPEYEIKNPERYQAWLKTNVFEQKQKGYYGAFVRIPLGDIDTERARILAALMKDYTADDVRVTVNQGLLFKYIRLEALPYIYSVLERIGFDAPGHDSTADIAACPGTDTCNLGITSSTGAAKVLEDVINNEYPDLVHNSDIKIKISGCMNACAQHNMVSIGFHGSSVKHAQGVVPALQVLLGGGPLGDGKGRYSDRVIKVPSKRGPDVLRALLDDYENNSEQGEYYINYYERKGKDYFYQLLKPFANLATIEPSDFVDWGHEKNYKTAIGIGECAGVVIDLISTLFYEADEKFELSLDNLKEGNYADSIYQSYTGLIITAKALLLDKSVNCNTHIGIIDDFQKHFIESGEIKDVDFKDMLLQINKNEPTKEFATRYIQQAQDFIKLAREFRREPIALPGLADSLSEING